MEQGTLRAAGRKATHRWIAEDVIPTLHKFAKANGVATGDASIYHYQGPISEVLKKQYGGSSGRILAALRKLHVITMVDFGRRGRTYVPPTYAINIRVNPDPRTIQRVLVEASEEAMERRREQVQQEAKEERLAGKYSTEAEGGPVTERHYHENVLTHPHGSLHPEPGEPHIHGPLEGYKDHDGPKGLVQGLDSAIYYTDPQRQVEYRHHTHKAEPTVSGTRSTVVDGLAGDRPAMLVSPEGDGRYRALLDLLHERDAALRRLEGRLEKAEGERDEYKAMVDRLTDPTVAEADAYLRDHAPEA